MLILALAGGVVSLAGATGCSSTSGCGSCRRQIAATPTPLAPVPAAAPAPRYGGQKHCPVNGDELGSMGDPIPVVLNGQTIYVCCKGCTKRALADPVKTLAAVEADRAVK